MLQKRINKANAAANPTTPYSQVAARVSHLRGTAAGCRLQRARLPVHEAGDQDDQLIRRIDMSTGRRKIFYSDMSTALVTTLAGSLRVGSTDGAGTTASFYEPNDVTMDAGGTFALVADLKNNIIRRIDASTASQTQTMYYSTSSTQTYAPTQSAMPPVPAIAVCRCPDNTGLITATVIYSILFILVVALLLLRMFQGSKPGSRIRAIATLCGSFPLDIKPLQEQPFATSSDLGAQGTVDLQTSFIDGTRLGTNK